MSRVSLIALLALPTAMSLVRPGAATDAGSATPVMSLDALRICIALEHETRELQGQFDSAELRYDSAQRAFRSQDHLVRALRDTLDLADARAVDDFNLKVKEQNRLLEEYHALVDPYNGRLVALQDASARLARDCNGSYLESDRLIILREREDAIRKRMEAREQR